MYIYIYQYSKSSNFYLYNLEAKCKDCDKNSDILWYPKLVW